MFDEGNRFGFSALLMAVQLVVVPLTGFIFGWLAFLAAEFVVGQFWQTFRDDGIGYLVYGGLGFLAGYMLQRHFPRLISSGRRWAWILPFLILCWGVIDDLKLGFLGDIRDIFAPGLRPEAGWVFVLVTMPTVCSLFYSIGAIVAARRQRQVALAA